MINDFSETDTLMGGYSSFLRHVKDAEEIIEKMRKVTEGVKYENLNTNHQLFHLIEKLAEIVYSGMELCLETSDIPDTDEEAIEYFGEPLE